MWQARVLVRFDGVAVVVVVNVGVVNGFGVDVVVDVGVIVTIGVDEKRH